GRGAARIPDRAERRQLGLAVEAVARLALPRRRPGLQHPAPVTSNRLGEDGLFCRARRANGREDAASRGVELLVPGAAGAERELLDAVASERGVRVTVDEPGDGAEAPTVELLDLAVESRKVAHAPHGLDQAVDAEHECVL